MNSKALPAILVSSFAGFCFVACTLDESGTIPTASTSSTSSSTSSSTTSNGMGGELFTTSSSSGSSGMGGMGGAGGGSSSSSSGMPLGKLGDECKMPENCSSGFCEDNVCCAAKCGECESCNQPGSMGTCKPLSIGSDDCTDNGKLCDKDGICQCGVSVPVAADATCPVDPKWSSPTPGECLYKCGGMDECKGGADVICAEGSDCTIECTGDGSCETKQFYCPKGHKCTLKCTNVDSCKNTKLHCSDDGPCSIDCTNSMSCNGADLICGNNACTATCVGGSGKPALTQKPDTASCLAMPCP